MLKLGNFTAIFSEPESGRAGSGLMGGQGAIH